MLINALSITRKLAKKLLFGRQETGMTTTNDTEELVQSAYNSRTGGRESDYDELDAPTTRSMGSLRHVKGLSVRSYLKEKRREVESDR